MYKALLGILLVAVTSGCGETFVSMNVQRSGLRATADVGATVYLDARDILVVDTDKVKLKEIANSIGLFLDTGNVALLPLDEVRRHLNSIVPVQYRNFVHIVLASVSTKTVSISGVGADNVARMRAALLGMNLAVDQYRNEHRKIVESVGN